MSLPVFFPTKFLFCLLFILDSSFLLIPYCILYSALNLFDHLAKLTAGFVKRFNLSEKKLSVVYVHSSPTRQETLSKEIISIFSRNDQLNPTCLILMNFVLFNRTQNRLNRPVWKITRPTIKYSNFETIKSQQFDSGNWDGGKATWTRWTKDVRSDGMEGREITAVIQNALNRADLTNLTVDFIGHGQTGWLFSKQI